jgi:Domain of unknown function DUF29
VDQSGLYDADILAWSEQQAAALRRLIGRADLPDELDLENVVEEVESVGRSELRATERFIELILLHLAKGASEPEAAPLAHWRAECLGWKHQLMRSFSPSMRARIDMDSLWRTALRQADAALAEHRASLATGLSVPCPVSLDELLSDELGFRDILAGIVRRLP